MTTFIRVFLILLLFAFLANLYFGEIDLQIAEAAGVDITENYAKRAIRVPVAATLVLVILEAIVRRNSEYFRNLTRLSLVFIILAVPSAIGSANLLSTGTELAGEFAIFSLALRAFQFRRFDVYFAVIAIIYLVVALAGCAVQNPNFLMSASHQFGCRGLTAHRNTFGPQVVFLLIYFFALFNMSSLRKYLLLAVLGLLSVMTRSVGTIGIYAVIFLATLFQGSFRDSKLGQVKMLFLAMGIGAFVVPLGLLLFSGFTDLIGRGQSFGARFDIYRTIPVLKNYILSGEGYKSLVSDFLRWELRLETGWAEVAGMHNSFLELWRQVGLIAASLLTLALAIVTVRVFVLTQIRDSLGFYTSMALIIFIMNGLWESSAGPYASIATIVTLRLVMLFNTRVPRPALEPAPAPATHLWVEGVAQQRHRKIRRQIHDDT